VQRVQDDVAVMRMELVDTMKDVDERLQRTEFLVSELE
jgi:hypothetical protein